MLTSDDHIDIALKSFHHGASDYVVKAQNQFEKINESILKIFIAKEESLQKEEQNKKEVEALILSKELRFKKALVFQTKEKEKKDHELYIANEQKVEIEKHKLALEEKNRDITDSILYAKRIQQAKLPKESEIYSALSDSFVLFKPKDIVSGDFYFFYENNDSIFIAAADCTGHGVPGAFMSMIGSSKLEEAVNSSSNTSEILNHLNKGMKNSLHQSDSIDSTRDGMDIAICSINTKSRVVKYAGANRPFWLIRENETILEEIKATKKAIGGLTEDNQFFDSHELKLNKGDTFYITTDGYADQFGGEHGKKLMTKKFKEILLGIQGQAMHKQKEHLDQFVEKWKSNIEQVDDILVIGVRL